MKVKCVLLLDADGREVDDSPWLRLGRIYHVMTMSIDGDGSRSYSIISHDKDPGWATMGSHSAKCFEIVSSGIPSNWRVHIRPDGAVFIAPGSWLKEGFLGAFYDRDPETYPIFERERDLIMREDP